MSFDHESTLGVVLVESSGWKKNLIHIQNVCGFFFFFFFTFLKSLRLKYQTVLPRQASSEKKI